MSTTREESTAMSDPESPRHAPGALRRALGSVPALAYLAVCVSLTGWAAAVSHGDNADASFAGVIPLLATAPVSLILLVLPDHEAMIYLAFGLGALANAAFIAWCGHALRRGRGGSGPTG